jgi:hypothetical protein
MKLIGILALCILSSSLFAQENEVAKATNSELIKFANSSNLIASTQEAQNIRIRIYTLHNEPGSAAYATGEVTHNILVSVSEYDEYPRQNLFIVSEFLSPSFQKWSGTKNDSATAIIEYGPYNARKSIKLKISINNVMIE